MTAHRHGGARYRGFTNRSPPPSQNATLAGGVFVWAARCAKLGK